MRICAAGALRTRSKTFTGAAQCCLCSVLLHVGSACRSRPSPSCTVCGVSISDLGVCVVSPGFRFPEGYTPPPSTRSRSRSRASQQVLTTRTATDFERLTSNARPLNEFRYHVGVLRPFRRSVSKACFACLQCLVAQQHVEPWTRSEQRICCVRRRQRRQTLQTLPRRWRRPVWKMSSSTTICDNWTLRQRISKLGFEEVSCAGTGQRVL